MSKTTIKALKAAPKVRYPKLGGKYSISRIKYQTVYGTDCINQVRIPWSREQWYGVTAKEGGYLGVCCGNISSIRDRVMSWLREDGWARLEDIHEVIVLLKSHDGFENLWDAEELEASYARGNPWAILVTIWNIVEAEFTEQVCPESQDRPPVPPKVVKEGDSRAYSELEDALFILSRGFTGLSHHLFFGRQESDKITPVQVTLEMTLARLLPALKVVSERITALSIGTLTDILAVTYRDKPDSPVEMRGGLAIFRDAVEAKDSMKHWINARTRDKFEWTKFFMVRRANVSLDKGLELLEEIPFDYASIPGQE